MYIANTQVITSDGTFAKGETVTGLTEADIKRMLAGEYITEVKEPKATAKDKAEKKEPKKDKQEKNHDSEEVE